MKSSRKEHAALAAEKSEINIRTITMNRFLLGFLHSKNYNNGMIYIAGKEYKIITSKVTRFAHRKIPLISCGSSISREFIILDPIHSPLLRGKYNLYKAKILEYFQNNKKNILTSYELVELTRKFMFEHVFSGVLSQAKYVYEIIQAYKLNPAFHPLVTKDGQGDITYIPIDYFIKNEAGVCRHHVLVAAYLLDRFIRSHANRCSFSGKVQIMRDEVKPPENTDQTAAHSWVSLVCNEGNKEIIYTLDSLNNLAGTLDDITFTSLFGYKFGNKAMQHQREKATELRKRL